MSHLQAGKKLLRKTFGRVKEVVSLPNLIEIQSKSYNDFIQLDLLPSERKKIGLEKILSDIFPVEHNERISLEYVSYELGDWTCVCGELSGIKKRYTWKCTSCKKSDVSRLKKDSSCPSCKEKTAHYIICNQCSSRVIVKIPMTVDECRYSGKTYAMPLKICVQLVTWDGEPESEKKVIRDIKEQEIFFCDLPIMIDLYENENDQYCLGNQGIFLINGIDRVVVSQLHRASGVVFTLSKRTKDYRGNPYHLARLIPSRGSWLDFEFDHNDILYVRIDKKKKILVTTFLQSIGIPREEILSLFYNFEKIQVQNSSFIREIDESLIGFRLEAGSLPPKIESKFTIGQRLTEESLEELKEANVTHLVVRTTSLVNRVIGQNVIHPDSGEIMVVQGEALTEEMIGQISKLDGITLDVIKSGPYAFQPIIALTLAQDQAFTYEEALKEVYYKLRPGDVPTVNIMEEYITNLFFNPRFYDLSIVGRIRTNRKLGLNVPLKITHLTKDDISGTIRYLVTLKEQGEGELDDIDHLGNRCVRLVGELLQSQLYVGFARIERIIKERFRLQEHSASLMPYDFINVKPLGAVLREFFGTGQLSQFMDQTNPLAEMAHKRRLSALGPGGITRERATFEVRDVHASHYGRICPIETPEGQNIGLISSLATYAHVNDLGFIETTYRPVKDGVIQDDVVCLDAFQEIGESIAQATVMLDKKKKMQGDKILARKNGNITHVGPEEISYVDASPRQLVSVATALIPFLEHDDANRALMGSNMQRQAVPLVKCQPPLVGTGMEIELGSHEGAALISHSAGTIEYVCSEKIVIRLDQRGNDQRWFSKPVEIYHLKKFARSSHNTWIHHTPCVSVGQRVKKGDVLTNGSATKQGELALGSNIFVAFMPWHGYNFEDAIIASKRLVSHDTFTSIHVEEFVVEARDTKLGAEEITCDIPNVNEKELEALDEDGIVQIGTRVKPGDILVGKVTLKGDVQVSPEEKLLRAIFGEKSREVRDTSLRVPPGIEATVVDVKVFSRSGIRKDKRYKAIVQEETTKIEENFNHHLLILKTAIKEKIIKLIQGTKAPKESELSKQGVFDKALMKKADIETLLTIKSNNKATQENIKQFNAVLKNQLQVLAALKEERVAKLRKGDDLPSGVIKMVRVSLAMKRRLSVGDKMAGRHGNKGVVSRIVNIEDMPYMADGTPIDLVLNPLGVPGRMNVGQILETMLGMVGREAGKKIAEKINSASHKQLVSELIRYFGKDLINSYQELYGETGIKELGTQVAKFGMCMTTPIFDGADYQNDIKALFEDLNLSSNGTYTLYNGLTGEPFDQSVTVGSIYMMKLNHLADDKLHARSVGPYSLITQQPLGGKAQFGGQRLGEMEVWALFAYGASYTLQEMLTVKSDDVNGRVKAYESIVRGDDVPEPGIPESFNVLIKELQSLGLQVDLFKTSKEHAGE